MTTSPSPSGTPRLSISRNSPACTAPRGSACTSTPCGTPVGAWLAMTGAHPKAVQSVMRHSTITPTMDTYGHLFPGQEADTVAKLPDMLPLLDEAAKATGTDGQPAESIPPYTHQVGGTEGHSLSLADTDESVLEVAGIPGENSIYDDSPGESGNASSRTRTLNPLIKSRKIGLYPTDSHCY